MTDLNPVRGLTRARDGLTWAAKALIGVSIALWLFMTFLWYHGAFITLSAWTFAAGVLAALAAAVAAAFVALTTR